MRHPVGGSRSCCTACRSRWGVHGFFTRPRRRARGRLQELRVVRLSGGEHDGRSAVERQPADGANELDAVHVPWVAESLGQEPRGELRQWAHAVVDAGADAVVGHGPHVLRGIELYRGRPIAYSLGNFLTYRGFNLSGPLGVTGVLQLELAPAEGLRRGRMVPMVQRPGEGPAPDPGGCALELIRQLSAGDRFRHRRAGHRGWGHPPAGIAQGHACPLGRSYPY